MQSWQEVTDDRVVDGHDRAEQSLRLHSHWSSSGTAETVLSSPPHPLPASTATSLQGLARELMVRGSRATFCTRGSPLLCQPPMPL